MSKTVFPISSHSFLRRFLLKYCTVETLKHTKNRRNDLGFARWENVVLQCRNLNEETIPAVVCDRRCTDPVTCKVLPTRHYCTIPNHVELKMPLREGGSGQMKIPVSCQCVACKSIKKNKTRKRNKRV